MQKLKHKLLIVRKGLKIWSDTLCRTSVYENLLCHGISVNPPKMLFPLLTMVTVGPLSSQLAWKFAASKPSRVARYRRHHSPRNSDNQPNKLFRKLCSVYQGQNSNELDSNCFIPLSYSRIYNGCVKSYSAQLVRNHSLMLYPLHCDWLLLSTDLKGYSRLRRSCKPINVPKSQKAVLLALDVMFALII